MLGRFLIADYEAALNTIFTCKEAELMPQEFAKLTVPTLCCGEYDKIIPLEMGHQAAAMNDKLEFVVIPNTLTSHAGRSGYLPAAGARVSQAVNPNPAPA